MHDCGAGNFPLISWSPVMTRLEYAIAQAVFIGLKTIAAVYALTYLESVL